LDSADFLFQTAEVVGNVIALWLTFLFPRLFEDIRALN
jgi:hypothetical protein